MSVKWNINDLRKVRASLARPEQPFPTLEDGFRALGVCPECRGTGTMLVGRSWRRVLCPTCSGSGAYSQRSH